MFNPSNWNWAVWAYLVLVLVNLLAGAYGHGKTKWDEGNFWVTLVSVIIGVSLIYFGGFFK